MVNDRLGACLCTVCSLPGLYWCHKVLLSTGIRVWLWAGHLPLELPECDLVTCPNSDGPELPSLHLDLDFVRIQRCFHPGRIPVPPVATWSAGTLGKER